MIAWCWGPAVDTPDLAPSSTFPAAALSPLLRGWRSLRDQPAVLASDILGAAARAGLVPRPDSSIRFSRHAPDATSKSVLCRPHQLFLQALLELVWLFRCV